jgi:hypothetical protein
VLRFRALNPNGLVPVLVDGDFVLWESNALITYLATTDRTPSLLPTDARGRADVDRRLRWQSAHLGPALSRMAFQRFVKPLAGLDAANGAALASAPADFARHCAALEDVRHSLQGIYGPGVNLKGGAPEVSSEPRDDFSHPAPSYRSEARREASLAIHPTPKEIDQ